MAGPNYFTQDDLEARFGTLNFQRVFSADSGRLNELSPRFTAACKVASRRIEALLGPGWDPAAIEVLLRDDEDIFAAGCDLVMADGMKTGRPEWSAGDGSRAPYAALRADAEKVLQQYAAAQLRPRAEATAGANPHTRVGKVRTRKILFAPTKDSPQRGGY